MKQIVDYEFDASLRSAMLRKGRPWRGEYQVGQRVAYWRAQRVVMLPPGYDRGTIMAVEPPTPERLTVM